MYIVVKTSEGTAPKVKKFYDLEEAKAYVYSECYILANDPEIDDSPLGTMDFYTYAEGEEDYLAMGWVRREGWKNIRYYVYNV